MKIKKELNALIASAMDACDIKYSKVSINDASKPEFGDYQYNGAMALAKSLGKNPREIATQIVEALPSNSMINKCEIAGPGFINIWLNSEWISMLLEEAIEDDRLGIDIAQKPETIVVDYSSPNMAKQMHVGHLRSTIIGDTITKLLSFLGEKVIRQNHIGDWGTQFGMLIAYMEEADKDTDNSLEDLEEFYKNAKVRFDEDANFADKAREYVVKLQNGDKHCLDLWQQFIDVSLGHCENVYGMLGISLSRSDVKAESSYNDVLPGIVGLLREQGVAIESDGALCVFMEGSDDPLMIQKSDGGFLYGTTDLAAIDYRTNILGATHIIYVVDARQSGHFRHLFDAAKKAGYLEHGVKLEHVSFGMMLDKTGKPFKTRDGGTVKLVDLLEESVHRAKDMMIGRGWENGAELEFAANVVGIGAVKYSELSINRESNYIFDWDKMLSFDGNTSLYMQYAYARIASILRRHDSELEGRINISDDVEHRLGLMLLRFEDVLRSASAESMPHYISTYLFDLVTTFMKFYEENPILKGNVDTDVRDSRLKLSVLVSRTIKKALGIMGIEVLDKL